MPNMQLLNPTRRLYARMVAYFHSWYVRMTIAKALLNPFSCQALTLQELGILDAKSVFRYSHNPCARVSILKK